MNLIIGLKLVIRMIKDHKYFVNKRRKKKNGNWRETYNEFNDVNGGEIGAKSRDTQIEAAS